MVSRPDDYMILDRLKKDFDTFSKAIRATEELLCKEMARNPKNSEAIKILCERLSRYREHGTAILTEISNYQSQIFKGA